MADRLTEIQDCLDQLLTQAYATLHYISISHAPAPIPGQPYQPPTGLAPGQSSNSIDATTTTAPSSPSPNENPNPDPESRPQGKPSQAQFQASLQELSRDLVRKERQIEELARGLPGLGRGRGEQESVLRGLEEELVAVRGEWEDARVRKGELVRRVEGVLCGVRRV